MLLSDKIEILDNTWPTYAKVLKNAEFIQPAFSTIFGYINGKYFSLYSPVDKLRKVKGEAFVVFRLGYKGMNQVGLNIESQGRLSYIDGCSATILINPPRLGEPSLHHLHFPANIIQSTHHHPSIRIGYVFKGQGEANINGKIIKLKPGSMFGLKPMEMHHFRTYTKSMDLVAFHPDGDSGPTDENHPMLNRTFIKRGK